MQPEISPSGTHAAYAAGPGVDAAPSFFEALLSPSGFMPRWECGLWSPALGWTHIISDVMIFVAYACIPLTLMFFVLRRHDIALKGIVWLFVAFILSCGLTHLADASMFYYPAYRMLGVMKAVTAIVSLATVVALFRVLPVAMSLPGIAEAHKLAQVEIERCKRAEGELVRTRDELESRGALLTGRLHRSRQALISSNMALVGWNIDSGEIAWEKGLPELFAAFGRTSEATGNWSDVLGKVDAAALRDAAAIAARDKRDLLYRISRADSNGENWSLELRARFDRNDPEGKAIVGSIVARPDKT